MQQTITIAPVRRSITVNAPPARAFDIFATFAWWPKSYSILPSRSPQQAAVLEQQVGGRWFERGEDGSECDWGKVLAWEPPSRLLLGWQITSEWKFDPAFVTEVELTFAPAEGGGTLVTLEHRNLERFGTDAAAHAEKLRGGWPTHLAQFAAYADAHIQS